VSIRFTPRHHAYMACLSDSRHAPALREPP
jgi:hypothetical protein